MLVHNVVQFYSISPQPHKDEHWLGTHDSSAPVSQAELIKKLRSRNFNDKNIITMTSGTVGWLMDHTATLNMTRIDVEKMIKKGEYSKPLWKRLLMYKGEGLALSTFWKLHLTACTLKPFSAVLPTMSRAEQTWCDVNLPSQEALLALGKHLSKHALLLLSSSANVMEINHKANTWNTEFQMYVNTTAATFSSSLKVCAALCGWVSWAKHLSLWVICEQNWFQLVLARAS